MTQPAGPAAPAPPAPLLGMRVVELAHWVAGPAVGGVLADWGASVVKVEPPGGDPMRHLFAGPGGEGAMPPSFSAVNRGKRSVVVDLTAERGRATLEGLLAGADVFVTNLRPGALERLDLTPDTVAKRHPALVYCSVSAYGWEGPDRDEAGYDLAGFFARAGVLHQLTPPGGVPSPYMNGIGDMFTAMSATAGVLAALHERHRTGRGRFVEASLLRSGMWSIAGELSVAAVGGRPRPVAKRTDSMTPLFSTYCTGDGRWFVLVGVEADRHLPVVLTAIGRADLLEDERFANGRAMRRNRTAFVELLDDTFRQRSLDEWAEVFARNDVWWAPVQSPADVVDDPQAAAAGGWVELAGGAGRSVDSPIRFDGVGRGEVTGAPRLGADTSTMHQGWEDAR